MGLFSTKKVIVVSSTVYNMAGPEEDRPNYLKSTMFSATVSPYDRYLGEVIVTNHLTGTGIRQRSFFNWAVRNDYPGLPAFTVQNQQPVDPEVIKPFIPVPSSPAGLETVVINASLEDGDFSIFADKWVLENRPNDQNTEYASEYIKDDHTIVIQFENGDTEIIPAGSYDPDKRYIVAYFYQTLASEVQPLEEGTLVTNVTDPSALPDTSSFTGVAVINTGIVTHPLAYDKTVTKVYSDGSPTTTTTTTETESVDFNGTKTTYDKSEYQGGDGSSVQTYDLATFLLIWERRHVVDRVSTTVVVNDLGGGETETVTTEIDGDHLDPIYDHRTDTQETINGAVVGGNQIWIYEMGSGNAILDGLETSGGSTASPEFYPYIPIRLNNKSITDPSFKDLYDASVTAYRKASGNGQRFSKLIEEVEDNEDLDEIDYACVHFGVALNVQENSCRKYLYKFLKEMISFQNTSGSYMDSFISNVENYNILVSGYDEWRQAQYEPSDPLYGTPAPVVPSLAKSKSTTIKLQTESETTDNFDMRVSWVSIDEDTFTGQGKPGAKKNEVWLEKDGKFVWNENRGLNSGEGSEGGGVQSSFLNFQSEIEKIKIYWQTDTNEYQVLTVWGLVHQNFIYGGKSVKITGHEALDDTDPSGFIFPLHNPTLREMSLVDTTQMATANTLIVFNSYKVYKKKWYQSFFGMLTIIVAIVAIAAVIAPAAIGGISGAFGTNLAVGTGLGFSGTTAVVVGAVTNALAAIVIATAVSEVSTELFGEKWGAIIGAIATFAISFGVTNGFGSLNLTTLMQPQNLLAMSSALANGYSGFVQANITEMQDAFNERAKGYQSELDEIAELIRELGGGNNLSFDPMQLTDVNAGNGQGSSYVPETLDEFIHRTTMTGSDIVDVTLSLITRYADLNLTLPES